MSVGFGYRMSRWEFRYANLRYMQSVLTQLLYINRMLTLLHSCCACVCRCSYSWLLVVQNAYTMYLPAPITGMISITALYEGQTFRFVHNLSWRNFGGSTYHLVDRVLKYCWTFVRRPPLLVLIGSKMALGKGYLSNWGQIVENSKRRNLFKHLELLYSSLHSSVYFSCTK